MKIVATVTNCGDYVHAGGGVSVKSCVIELPEPLPQLIKNYLDSLAWSKEAPDRYTYETINFSILDEESNS